MQIKSFCPRLKKQLGFTMIELLIVIAILGILAVAVLSAINPIEQINRGRDTGNRSDAEQLLSAIERFYAMTGYYPWTSAVGNDSELLWVEANAAWILDIADHPDFDACPILNRLSDTAPIGSENCNDEPGTQELKLGYVQKLDDTRYNALWVYKDNLTYTSTYVCFAPQSSAFQQEAAERATGVLPADFPTNDAGDYATGNTTDCGVQGFCICLP